MLAWELLVGKRLERIVGRTVNLLLLICYQNEYFFSLLKWWSRPCSSWILFLCIAWSPPRDPPADAFIGPCSRLSCTVEKNSRTWKDGDRNLVSNPTQDFTVASIDQEIILTISVWIHFRSHRRLMIVASRAVTFEHPSQVRLLCDVCGPFFPETVGWSLNFRGIHISYN